MNARTIRIEPLFVFGYGGRTQVFYEDLIDAEIGDCWIDENFEYYPRETEQWKTELKVIYKDKCGVLISYRDNIKRWNDSISDFYPEEKEFIWIEKHPESTSRKN